MIRRRWQTRDALFEHQQQPDEGGLPARHGNGRSNGVSLAGKRRGRETRASGKVT